MILRTTALVNGINSRRQPTLRSLPKPKVKRCYQREHAHVVAARMPETTPIDSRTGGYPRSLSSAIHYDHHVPLPQMSGAPSTTQTNDITVAAPPVTPQLIARAQLARG